MEALMRKWWPVAAVLAVPIVLALTFVAWLAVALWEYEHRPGAVLAHNFDRIKPGMRLEQVNSLLGLNAREIMASEIPIINDSTEPDGSSRRMRRAVSGDSYFKWETKDGAQIIVGLRGGVVSERYHYEPSL
jgi:hypothetical protein